MYGHLFNLCRVQCYILLLYNLYNNNPVTTYCNNWIISYWFYMLIGCFTVLVLRCCYCCYHTEMALQSHLLCILHM